MKKSILYWVGGICTACVLLIASNMMVHSQVSELGGLAVAQSAKQWTSVKDASQGDGLTSGLLASGMYLFNGLSFDRLRGSLNGDGNATTGVLSASPLVFNGTNYDRVRGGLSADATSATGLLNNAQYVFNGSTYDRVRNAVSDSMAATGIVSAGNLIFNGGTWDRMRTALGDNIAATGILANGRMGFDGATWDRQISVSNTNNTAITSSGAAYVVNLVTWGVTSTPATGTQASASKAAGGGTVRHVAQNVTWCIAANAVAQTPILIHLRDGASGTGTILKTWAVSALAGTSVCGGEQHINRTGSANTAMTLETAGAPAAGVQATVTLEGYSTP